MKAYRLLLLAVLVSAAIHAAVIVGTPGSLAKSEGDDLVTYSATLDEGATVLDTAAPPKPAPPKPARKPRPKAKLAPLPNDLFAQAPSIEAEPQLPDLAPTPDLTPKPERVAIANPTAPPPAQETPAPEPFNTAALPGRMKISYSLTSSFADGRATYEWERDGDDYTISCEAEAVGFFTLFLEGRILQESRGKVTSQGLRPERFVERRPNNPAEGLEFDWSAKKVTFDRDGEKRTGDLKENTVDWLSMIFQLAHQPPKGETFGMSVYTQKRMYQFQLKVVGEEEIEIPIGKVRALHIRHADEQKNEFVDVWLGIDQHYVPVKMRYPVARNRIMVEQTATDITER